MSDNLFNIKIKPTFDFNLNDIQKQIDSLKISPVKINIDKTNLENSLKEFNDLKLNVSLKVLKGDLIKQANSIIKDINNIETKGNITKLKVRLQVLKGDIISDANSILKDINKNLKISPIKIPISIDKQEIEKSIINETDKNNNLKKDNKINKSDNKEFPTIDNSLLSESIRTNLDTNTVVATTKVQKNLLETIKEIKNIDLSENTISTTIEEIKNYEKLTKNLYSQLKKEEKELNDLRERQIKNDKSIDDTSLFDEIIKKKEENINLIKSEIDKYGLTNKALEEEIDLLNKILQLRLDIKKSKEDKNLQNILYGQLKKEEKELLSLQSKKEKATEINTISDYNLLISQQEETIKNLRDTITSRSLNNELLEKEIELLKRKSDLQTKTKDEDRQFKIGRKISDFKTSDLLTYEKSEEENLSSFVNKFLEERGISGQLEGITSLKEKIKGVNDVQKEFVASVKTGQGQVTDFSFAIDKSSNSVFELGSKVRRVNHTIAGFGALMTEMVEKVAQWNTAVNIFYGSLDFLTRGFDFFKQLDSDLTQVALVTGQTRNEVESLKQEYIELSKATKRTISDISSVNAELVRQGLSADESRERLETILKLSAVGGQTPEESLKLITSSVNSLGETAERTADIMVLADNISASSLDGIGRSLQKVGVTSKIAGLSLEETVGIIATLSDVTQEAPEALGNALRSIIARFSQVDLEGNLNEDLNEIQTAIESIGVSFVDSQGEIRDFYDIMNDLANVWNNLSKNQKASLGTTIAGSYQLNRFNTLIENWDRVQDITQNLETNSLGTLDNAFVEWQNSIQAKVNETISLIQQFWLEIFDEDAIKDFLNSFQIILSLLNNLEKNTNLLSLSIKGLFGIMALKFLGLYDALKLNNMGFSQMKNLILNTTDAFKNNNNSLKENIRLLIEKIKRNKELTQSEKKIQNKDTDVTTTNEQKNKKTSKTGGGFFLGSLIGGLTKATLIGAGIDLISTALNKLLSGFNTEDVVVEFTNLANNIKETSSNFRDEIKTLEDLNSEFKRYQDILGSNNDLTKLNNKEKARYLEITQQIANISPESVAYWDLENGAMLEYGVTIDEIIKKKKELYQADIQQQKINFQNEFNKNAKNILEETAWKKQELLNQQYDILTYGDFNVSWIDKVFNNINKFFHTKFGTFDFTDIFDPFSEKNLKSQISEMTQPLDYINSLKEKLSKASGEEAVKIASEIERVEIAMKKLNAEQDVANKHLDGLIAQAKTVLNLSLNDYFQSLGDSVSSLDKKIITDTTNMYLEEAIKNNPSKLVFEDAELVARSLTDIISETRDILSGLNTEDLVKDETISKLKDLELRIQETGISANGSKDAINSLMIEILGLGNSAESTVDKLEKLKMEMLDNFAKIDNYQDIFEKASSKSLSFSDAMNFIEDNPEVLKKVNEGLETNLAIQEIALEKIEETNLKTEESIDLANQQLKIEKEALLLKKKNIENTLLALEKKGDVGTSSYRNLSDDLKEVDTELKNIDLTILENKQKLNGYRKVFEDIFDSDHIDKQLQSSIQNIQKYNEILDMLNNNGITYDLQQKIISQYPDLIMYLNDEVALRELLQNLIIQEEQIQVDSYNKKILYSTQFKNAFINNNAQMINDLANKYNIDLQNFANVQQQKTALLNAMNQNMYESAKLSVDYLNMNASQLAQEYTKITGLGVNEKFIGPLNLQYGDHQKAGAIKDLYKFQSKVEETIKTPTINPIKPPKLLKAPSVGGGGTRRAGGAGGSGSKKKRQEIELVELEKEKYLKLNKELEKNNRLIEKNAKLIDYAFAEDKIKLINKEIELLTQRQKLDNQLANQYREEQKKLKEELSKSFSMNNDGLDDFPKYMEKKEKEINDLINKINKSTDDSTIESLTEKKDKIQKEVNKIADKYKKYIEITFSSIPNLQDDYTEQIFKKFDRMLEMMQVKIEAYQKEIGRLTVLRDIRITGKRDNTTELEYELQLYKEINQVFSKQMPILKQNIDLAKSNLQNIEDTLAKIKDKNSQDYKNNETNLILAKKQLDEAIAIYETAIQSYADNLNSKVQTEIDLLEKLKDKAKESLEDLRKDINTNSLFNYETTIKSIELALKKMDGIFIRNPKVELDTSVVYDEIRDSNKTIDNIRKNTEKWKKALDKVANSNSTNKEILQEVEEVTKQLILLENSLKEQIQKKTEEIANLKLEYQAIEDALQNEIDLKEEALDKLEEEKKHEQDLLELIKKRLALLNALDDRSHMYVTGQGTVEYTYDKYEVNKLLQDLLEEQKNKEYEEKRKKLEEEIAKMVEELNKTKEIHEHNLAVNEAQLEQLKKEQEYLSTLIESGMDLLDKKFDKIVDKYIDMTNKAFQENTSVLLNIYDLLKNSSFLSRGFNYGDINTKTIQANKDDKTLQDIARKYNISLNELLKLNKGLSANSILQFGQQIKIPAFDTGGYTGDFNGGRLAILHQKELVLNPMDTQNLLNTISLLQQGRLFNLNNGKEENINIHIGNINLPSVNNSSNFINEISRISRNAIGRLN